MLKKNTLAVADQFYGRFAPFKRVEPNSLIGDDFIQASLVFWSDRQNILRVSNFLYKNLENLDNTCILYKFLRELTIQENFRVGSHPVYGGDRRNS